MEIVIALLLLVLLLMIGVAVPFAFFTTIIYLIFSLGYDSSFLVPYGFSQIGNVVLLAIPLFIMAGGLMDRGGIGDKIVDLADVLVGKTKGGLGIVAIVSCGIFGAISGSGSAALTSIGSIIMPRLEKNGYPRGFTTSLITSASVLGLLIPPSGLMILYAWASNQSVLASFLATVIPGIILAIFLSIVNIVYFRIAKITPKGDYTDEKFTIRLRKSTISAVPGLMLPVIILGGIYGGFVTPTEAAGIAVVYTIPVGFWIYKRLNRKNFFEELTKTATTTGTIMIMLFSIMMLSRIFVMEGVPARLTDLLLSITENKVLLLLIINLILLIIGMLMDDASAVLLATPVLLPIAMNIEVDPIHFAAIVGVNLGLGCITPPTAPLLYLGSRIGKTPVKEMLGPTFLLIIFAWVPTLVITTFFPEVALYLPTLLLNR
ncbi:TRAP transporter large permease [Robertmurraya korlensis]|uniref:TRAP transporter large permease n=1 Tax=Robertmurraya korlensis TaxID=519977 RepID=UPI000824C1FB|nr:TRAP transporter large permease [Robertmurraya korlensis]